MNETSRAAFLAAGTAGAALIASATPATAAVPPGVANVPALESILHRPAKHKQVIAAPKVDGGAPLRYAMNTINAFQFAYGEGPGTVHCACVFYGPALFIAANDALWGRYSLFDVLDSAGDSLPAMVHTPQNPFLHARSSLHTSDSPDDLRGFYHDGTVEALTRRGLTLLVCNNALTEVTRQIAAAQKADPHNVYDDFRHNLVPGVVVVPAGVAAIVLAQEAGFTFLPA
jgi:intracellular sulfur oxidation DsrE/DsrF family protein